MGKKKGRKKEEILLKGVLDMTRSGMGYVVVEDLEDDILIKPNDLNRAFDGDTVLIKIKPDGRGKRKEGIIQDVIKRKQINYIGGLELSEHFAFFKPSGEKPMPDFYISKENINGGRNNDRVVVELLQWAKDEKKPEGRVIAVLDAVNAADMAMKEIIIQNGFSLKFPKEVINETKALNGSPSQKDISERRDYRKTLTFTIDPADAKDFDDALSLSKLSEDEFEMGVHIADVSHFVTPGSELDAEGYKRATSVYLPDRVVPMLPEKISNELCSLRPHEDKFCFSAIFRMNKKGEVKDYWLGKTLINSDHRFNYDEVQQIIEQKEGQYKDEILLLDAVAKTLRKQRFDRGAISFSSVESKFKLDEAGNPLRIVIKESTDSHHLIEEFMLLANRMVATHVHKIRIHKNKVPFPYRIHDEPDEEKLKPFAAFARTFGYEFNTKSPEEIATSFNRMLKDVEGKPEEHVLVQLGIRTMAKAAYSTENIGHYGLGFVNYCHFTSPIRRYPDIMVHRVLQQILQQRVEPDKKMEQKCKHCSEQERAAMEAERAGKKYKQVQFMKDKEGEEFDGIINGVSSFGFWVETVNEKCEGLVNIKDLSEYDDFKHDETSYSLVGMRTGKSFRMGDTVRVQLVAANLEKRQLDFDWIPDMQKSNNQTKDKKKKNKKYSRKHK